ncbi:hypothetical protein Dda3937_04015 [Dickeya dadantii 3937]|uniref:Uncharacterized protein n=1 Tax=Dickeya dadantii (strain 3937) TaxID=198628 RepID=E0SKC3_DICD3|nr:hypothetical protein Dda3937_04015 [Dickeya dadantii 3937]
MADLRRNPPQQVFPTFMRVTLWLSISGRLNARARREPSSPLVSERFRSLRWYRVYRAVSLSGNALMAVMDAISSYKCHLKRIGFAQIVDR